jgi:hypothetical protein
MQALSQLSYGPLVLAQCSGELEILSPIDELALIVSSRTKSKADLSPPRKLLNREEVATIKIRTVRGECVDLIGRVGTLPHTLTRSPGRVATNDEDIPVHRRPLALHPPKPVAKIEDQVKPPAFRDGLVDIDA